MTTYDLPTRQARYFAASSQLAHLDNAQVRTLFDTTESATGDWRRNHIIDIGHAKVFVKRLPLTQREYENLFSTKNLYDLPSYYNYGVGSFGFGAFRELVANIKTTNWVLEGVTERFPLLYHYRLLPCFPASGDDDISWQQRYIAYWNSNAQIRNYIQARAQAPYELALFVEHMPDVLGPWLREHPSHIRQVLADLREAAAFLHAHGIVHYDINFDNVLIAGERAYVTDFGLVLDSRFTLMEDEVLFLHQGIEYDYACMLGNFGYFLFQYYDSLPDSDKQQVMRTYGITNAMHFSEQTTILLNNLESIVTAGLLSLDTNLLTTAVRYRSIISLYLHFYADMQGNNQKDTPFPSTTLTQLLHETEFLSGSI